MKLKYLIPVFAFLLLGFLSQQHKIGTLKRENDRLGTTNATLLDSVRHYRTESGQNAAKVGALILTIDDLKKYRRDDYNTIKELSKKRDAERYTKVSVVTHDTIFANLIDTIRIVETDTLRFKCIDVDNKWYSLHGCLDDNDVFFGDLTTTDELRIVETVKYKRFLGFLWKTNKVKDRQVDVVSMNPSTTIGDVEFIVVEK